MRLRERQRDGERDWGKEKQIERGPERDYEKWRESIPLICLCRRAVEEERRSSNDRTKKINEANSPIWGVGNVGFFNKI